MLKPLLVVAAALLVAVTGYAGEVKVFEKCNLGIEPNQRFELKHLAPVLGQYADTKGIRGNRTDKELLDEFIAVNASELGGQASVVAGKFCASGKAGKFNFPTPGLVQALESARQASAPQPPVAKAEPAAAAPAASASAPATAASAATPEAAVPALERNPLSDALASLQQKLDDGLSAFKSALEELKGSIDTKADKAEVEKKADKSAVTALAAKVTLLEQRVNEHGISLSGKINRTELETVNETLKGKVGEGWALVLGIIAAVAAVIGGLAWRRAGKRAVIDGKTEESLRETAGSSAQTAISTLDARVEALEGTVYKNIVLDAATLEQKLGALTLGESINFGLTVEGKLVTLEFTKVTANAVTIRGITGQTNPVNTENVVPRIRRAVKHGHLVGI